MPLIARPPGPAGAAARPPDPAAGEYEDLNGSSQALVDHDGGSGWRIVSSPLGPASASTQLAGAASSWRGRVGKDPLPDLWDGRSVPRCGEAAPCPALVPTRPGGAR
jgi:hypothetical protein